MSRVASCFLLGLALCCLLGADIAFDPNSPVPNPNNMPLTIQGSGTFNLGEQEQLSTLFFYAYNRAIDQMTAGPAAVDMNKKKWDRKLLVNPAGDYECFAVLKYVDDKGNYKGSATTQTIKITVK